MEENQVRDEHEDQYHAKGAHNRRASRQIQQNGKVDSQRRDQCTHGPSDRQARADAIGEEHGTYRGDDQIAKD